MINRLKQRMHQDEGFTLIELLIVIVVLGILAAIVVFALSNQTSNAAKSACNADAKSVEVAVEAYRAQTSNYPANVAALTAGGPAAYLRQAPPTNPALDAAGVPNGTLATATPANPKYAIAIGQNVGGSTNAGKVYVLTNGTGAVWTDFDSPGGPNPCDAAH
jgi:general secretion pathway protein G